MRSSTIVALAAIAAAAPSLAAPVQYARDSSSAQAPSSNESDALSLGTVSSIVSVAAPVVSGIINHFKNKYVFFYPLPEEDLMVPSQRQLEPAS